MSKVNIENKRKAFLKCALWSRCLGLKVVSDAGIAACEEILDGGDYRTAVFKMKETVYKHYREKYDVIEGINYNIVCDCEVLRL